MRHQQAAVHQHETEQALAFLQITLVVDERDRATAAGVYARYKQPFLDNVPGAASKELLVRDEDVVGALSPLLKAEPEIRIYETA
ncbi:hypothetical protein OF385_00805 [Glutamicibacter sp. JL.03c]|uniref:hypothetical protein n=1 Tax=Glutamicibacter sp. JL.03c TaxID=2984842 RepID=UPI0021F786AA|nr:hypothetical protein [Glutamicibacter sp. JL.03c]UYQ77754.1 hypothetical protein OF385_00805 [Glutamicibacter sp. JL.03c]